MTDLEQRSDFLQIISPQMTFLDLYQHERRFSFVPDIEALEK